MGQIQQNEKSALALTAAERADIAALESRSSRGSRASHAPSQTAAQYGENWFTEAIKSLARTRRKFQVEFNGHASAKDGLSPHLAEVPMPPPPPTPLLFQCDAPKAGSWE
ncbi:hypothetical protein ACJJTC_015369 [Scirpophaga incertulas]